MLVSHEQRKHKGEQPYRQSLSVGPHRTWKLRNSQAGMHTATDYFLVRLCFSTNGSLREHAIIRGWRPEANKQALSTPIRTGYPQYTFSGMRKGNSTDRQIYKSRLSEDTCLTLVHQSAWKTNSRLIEFIPQPILTRTRSGASIRVELKFIYIFCTYIVYIRLMLCTHALETAVHWILGFNQSVPEALEAYNVIAWFVFEPRDL